MNEQPDETSHGLQYTPKYIAKTTMTFQQFRVKKPRYSESMLAKKWYSYRSRYQHAGAEPSPDVRDEPLIDTV